MGIVRKIGTAIDTFRKGGFGGVRKKIEQKRRVQLEEQRYRQWLKRYAKPDDKSREAIRNAIVRLKRKPLISVLLPVYNIDEKWLRRCIDSVRGQLYENWELCIADDHSTAAHVRVVLDEYAKLDQRIKVTYRPENGHISAASNSALELVTGEFVVLLDHDDELSEDALYRVASEMNQHPDAAMIYSDEDKIDERGRRYAPAFKPDWSRDLFYSLNLVTHLSAYRTDILRRIGGFRVGFEGSQDYDLALRFIEQITDEQIRHIPRILYHWRAIEGSVALSGGEKPYAHERARAALREHLGRSGVSATVEATVHDLHRVRYELPEPEPSVSLIVYLPDGDANTAAREILSKTYIANVEVTALAGKLTATELNRAVEGSRSDVICFVDGRLRPLSPDWLREMLSFALQEQVGAVGAKLLSPDGTIAHAGIIIGSNGSAFRTHSGVMRDDAGYFFRAGVINNYSAVSAACMAIRREVFDEADGFDAEDLNDGLFDVDICLRLGEKGYRTVYTPYAELGFEGNNVAIGIDAADGSNEREYFAKTWKNVIERDPFYSPNLDPENGQFRINI